MSCKHDCQKDWFTVKAYDGAFISIPPEAFKLIQRMRDEHDKALHALMSVTAVLEDFNASTWCMRGKRRATIRVVLDNSNHVLKNDRTACRLAAR